VLQPETMATSVEKVDEHIVEFVSDSGEGAQTAGQMFGTVSAQMGNGVWTVEIIPSEIEPPPRSKGGTSGNRIRISGSPVTNMGEAADVVVAFNEQVLFNRIDDGALREGTILFLENVWADSPSEETRTEYAEAREDFERRGFVVIDVPMDVECRKIVPDPRRGKNMWALGMISAIYERDLDKVEALIEQRLGRKGEKVVSANQTLVRAGYDWATRNVEFRYRVAVQSVTEEMVVMNGNKALALGVLSAGIEVCSMYPITPATSVSHYLAQMLPKVGGFLHQAEDEIAAIGFALGAAFGGMTTVTVTSGPGLALMT
jgi:2-oxoglutarate ferredoxin oxidoreductase subunit alpha